MSRSNSPTREPSPPPPEIVEVTLTEPEHEPEPTLCEDTDPDEILRCFRDSMERKYAFIETTLLTPAQREELAKWEAEQPDDVTVTLESIQRRSEKRALKRRRREQDLEFYRQLVCILEREQAQ